MRRGQQLESCEGKGKGTNGKLSLTKSRKAIISLNTTILQIRDPNFAKNYIHFQNN